MGDASQQINGRVQHVAIEIAQLNKGLAESIKGKLESSIPSLNGSQCSIYRVHEKFCKLNKYAYTPEMISIGPFHRGKGNLPAMEDHKLRYVHALLSRTATIGPKLEECVESIREIEEEARKCYSEPINMNSNEFVEMMLVDGLFIIELFRKSAGKVKSERDDPIFGNIWGLSSLVRDLILLENQIPMRVLNCLFNQPALKEELEGSCSFNMLALRFFNPLMPREKEVLKNYSKCEGKHLLDLLGKTFHDLPERGKSKNNSWKFIPSVTELKRAGVKFKKSSTRGSFLDIKFNDGVLEIPPVIIQDQTDSLLRNLIASEQCCDGHVTYMTSYAFFMDSLINSADDVGLLRNQGIITNYLGDDEDVSALFNKLCCEVTLANFYYAELCDQVNIYYKTRWHKWRATLKRDYFHNPWAILSVIAAVVLLALTLTSTIFGSLSYLVHKS
ncbi:Protein of unknown function DUF247 [Macleaya cordata]|uniref:Uncharacterized protein n=1 Tax=Macleaya cordata TaxID=56857 RepID=A0A200R1B4_MACCD|nr:Protein of unknown function DUF247 [Macleaya cordata]